MGAPMATSFPCHIPLSGGSIFSRSRGYPVPQLTSEASQNIPHATGHTVAPLINKLARISVYTHVSVCALSSFELIFSVLSSLGKAPGSEAEVAYTWREMPGSLGASTRHLVWKMVLMKGRGLWCYRAPLGVLVSQAAINIYHLEGAGVEVEKARLGLLLRLAAQRLVQQTG